MCIFISSSVNIRCERERETSKQMNSSCCDASNGSSPVKASRDRGAQGCSSDLEGRRCGFLRHCGYRQQGISLSQATAGAGGKCKHARDFVSVARGIMPAFPREKPHLLGSKDLETNNLTCAFPFGSRVQVQRTGQLCGRTFLPLPLPLQCSC